MLDLSGPSSVQGMLDHLRALCPGHVRSSQTAKGGEPQLTDFVDFGKGPGNLPLRKNKKIRDNLPFPSKNWQSRLTLGPRALGGGFQGDYRYARGYPRAPADLFHPPATGSAHH